MDEKDLEDKNLTNGEVSSEEKIEVKETKKQKKDKMEILKEENHQLKESYLKSIAELENYKKRMNDERIKDRKYGSTNLIHDLLIPLDQFKKVVGMNTEDPMLKNFLIGFKMISDNIFSVLEEDGVKEIDALNKQFDPNYHYAVEKTNNPDVENGIVTEVEQVGYMYKERLLRPSMVKVNEWSENENEQNN